jgi:hypothetical protein
MDQMMGIFMLYRVAAAQERQSRIHPDTLKLIAGATYTLNALIRSPGCWHHDRQLCLTIWWYGKLRTDCDTVIDSGFYTPNSSSADVPLLSRGAMWFPEINWTRR